MTKLDFPDTPSTGQQYGSSGTVWRWDGTRWASTSGASGQRGVLGYKVGGGSYALTAGGPDVAITTIAQTLTFVAGRTYRVSATLHWTTNSIVDDDVAFGSNIYFDGVKKRSSQSAASSRMGGVYTNDIDYVWTQASNATIAITFTGFYGTHAGGSTGGKIYSTADFPFTSVVEDITYDAGSSPQGVNDPRGSVAYAETQASQGSITSIVDVTGLSVSFTANPTRRYKTTVRLTPSSSVINDDFTAFITDAGNTVKQTHYEPYLDNNTSSTAEFSVIESGLSGTVTRKVRASRSAGTGSVALYSSATAPAYILVEDITPGPTGPGTSDPWLEVFGKIGRVGGQASVDLIPPARLQIEAKSVVCVSVGGGWGSFNFEQTFQSEPMVVAMAGDSAAGLCFITQRSIGLSSFAFVATYHDGTGPASGAQMRINYIAMAPRI